MKIRVWMFFLFIFLLPFVLAYEFSFMDGLTGRIFFYFGAFMGLLLLIFIVFLIIWRIRKKKSESPESRDVKAVGGSNPVNPDPSVFRGQRPGVVGYSN